MPTDVPSVRDLLDAAVTDLGGQSRDGQREMADAVTSTMADGGILLVQAGTGTGKSLGYLVPAARHVAAVDGGRVVVSTATLALQNQIVRRDLPRLAGALKPVLGREITFATVKGRANYLCRHKLAGQMPDDDRSLFTLDPLPGTVVTAGPSSSLGKEVVRLREWAEETDSGDRDDLTPGVGERAWRQVSVTARECLGGKCPDAVDCFSERARATAREVDIVVTNHALLAIDTFEERRILPDHDALVVDEAHDLADRVTGVVSGQLTVPQVEGAATSARRHGGCDVDALLDRAQTLETLLDALPEGRLPSPTPDSLLAVLASIRDEARSVTSELKNPPGRGPEAAGPLQVARAAVTEVFETADRLCEDRPGDVAWLAVSDGRGGTRRTLNVAPLGVATRLRDRLYEGRAVILTSATLTVGGTFEQAERSVGLFGESAPAHADLDVASPFDYPRQAILYVAAHLPRPGRDGAPPQVVDELAALIEAAGGRTLALFSSRRAAENAAASLRDRLDVPILCQGEDWMPALVRRFGAEPATCLFGTLSLWQGVDVPGPSCRLVVIDRIPFPRPDDPLMSARAEAVTAAGGNGFMRVSVNHAGLRLAQGAGRLIRSVDDRGVVAVLDQRLATARYGHVLAASLPPMWRTTNRDLVLSALRRLDDAGSAPQATPGSDTPQDGDDPAQDRR